MRVKTEARRLAYIQAASKLFLEHGYADVSMEKIAAAAGGSKVTLYGYFASKEELFEAFVVEIGRGKAQGLQDTAINVADPVGTLRSLGLSYLRLVTEPQIVTLDRLIISESRRFPQLTKIFYDHGPRRVIGILAQALAKIIDGQLTQEQAWLRALQFKALCEATILERQLWCLDPQPTAKTLKTAVEGAVTVFLDGVTPRLKLAPALNTVRKS